MKAFTLTAIAAAIALAAPAAALAGMSKADFQAAKATIEGDYKTDKAGCEPLAANAKDICMVEARGKEKVSLAELGAAYKPTQKSRYDARLARVDADYALAKEKCDDKSGNPKDVCVKQAQAARTTAKADAKAHMKTVDAGKAAGKEITEARKVAGKEIVEARKDAAAEKLDAEYAVEKQKCDAYKGSLKEACLSDARARYGRS